MSEYNVIPFMIEICMHSTVVCDLVVVHFQAVVYLSVPIFPAGLISVVLTHCVIYLYFSSICTEIKKDPKTSTYYARFPFRCVTFFKNASVICILLSNVRVVCTLKMIPGILIGCFCIP